MAPMTAMARLAVAALASAIFATSACAEYPDHAVRIITASPGTLMDAVARQLAHSLGERWGQPVIVENRGGASFTIGMAAAAKAKGDGYTLVMSDRTALAAAPHLYKHVQYDPFTDFAPVTVAAAAPLMLVAHPSVPA